jgi:Type I phosphodiesterase / nucleotide pyrophosphatase/Hemopexin
MIKFFFLIFFLCACSSKPLQTRKISSLGSGKIKRVILIGIDGLGGQYIEKGDIPNLRKLMAEGSYTLKMENEMPTVSATNWFSMLSSSESVFHGIKDWNGKPDFPDEFSTIFQTIKSQSPDSKVVTVYNWDGIRPLILEKAVEVIDKSKQKASEVEVAAIDFLKKEKPLFSFIYFVDVDESGHKSGWGKENYYRSLHDVDSSLGRILSTLNKEGMMNETLIIVSADHGGKRKSHGPDGSIYREIPFIAFGPNIKSGYIIEEKIRIIDIVPTIAASLGVTPNWQWKGKVIKSIFQEAPEIVGSYPPVVNPKFSKLEAGLKMGNSAYVFRDKDFSRFDLITGEEDIQERSNWNFYGLEKFEGGPDDIDAAINWGNGSAYFFKGKEFVEINLNTNHSSGVKIINKKNWPGLDVFKKIDAAENFGQGLAYFFSGDQFLVYDVKKKEPIEGHPRTIKSQDFPGLEKFLGGATNFDAVINWGNGKVYFFKGEEYIRFDIKNHEADQGFPKTLN